MTNRIKHLLDDNSGFNPNSDNDMEQPELPEGFDPRRLPPAEPNSIMPLQVGVEPAVLLKIYQNNLERLLELAPEIDAADPTGESAAETQALVQGFHTMIAWLQQHPGPLVLMATYPVSELEEVTE